MFLFSCRVFRCKIKFFYVMDIYKMLQKLCEMYYGVWAAPARYTKPLIFTIKGPYVRFFNNVV